jgi:hydroxyethylthiazole kinase-like uncharacterized protein yjeF
MKVVTAAQMIALEQVAVRHGVSTDILMENAGRGTAEAARALLNTVAGVGVLVLVGPGNNGADGLVAARYLKRWGAEVTAYVVTSRPHSDPKMKLALDYGVAVIKSSEDSGLVNLDHLLQRCRLVIDAVLGIGRSRGLEGVIKEAMLRLAASQIASCRPLILALDIPTGIDADTGKVDPACSVMDLTVALGRPKVGLLTMPGGSRVGQLQVVDIGLSKEFDAEVGISTELMDDNWTRCHLPVRSLDSHKGTFGHAMVVAGSQHYVGAAYLSAQAAVRAGAGLVTLAAPRSVYAIVASRLTEVIHLPLPEDAEGRIHPDAAQIVRENLFKCDSLLVGCGLGSSIGTADFLERLLLMEPRPALPTVIDADGLNNLSQMTNWWQRLGGPVVLTPHPGEMAALTMVPTYGVQQDRISIARQWAAHWSTTIVLKGAHTVVAEPEGPVQLSPFANPGLASGGTGDVLTGVIAGLMAQGLSIYDAACCGVFIHGKAAEAVRWVMGDAGSTASDLIEQLPVTMDRLRRGRILLER